MDKAEMQLKIQEIKDKQELVVSGFKPLDKSDKVTIELSTEDAKLIKTWLENQDYDDTLRVITDYSVGINAIHTDEALNRLCKQLREEC